jgi:hypothetical protein
MLVQIQAEHFCAGLVLENEICVDAAPIIKYMLGWNRERIRNYCRKKGWRAIVVGH